MLLWSGQTILEKQTSNKTNIPFRFLTNFNGTDAFLRGIE
jgi:hypothetical protein